MPNENLSEWVMYSRPAQRSETYIFAKKKDIIVSIRMITTVPESRIFEKVWYDECGVATDATMQNYSFAHSRGAGT